MTRRCQVCHGEGVINAVVGAISVEADLCPECGGTGIVESSLRDWIRSMSTADPLPGTERP